MHQISENPETQRVKRLTLKADSIKSNNIELVKRNENCCICK